MYSITFYLKHWKYVYVYMVGWHLPFWLSYFVHEQIFHFIVCCVDVCRWLAAGFISLEGFYRHCNINDYEIIGC